MRHQNDHDSQSQIRLDDISTFIAVYELVASRPQGLTTFKDLYSRLRRPASTVIGHLSRITSFLFEGAPHLQEGTGFEQLFRKSSKSGGLTPTPAAAELYGHFKTIAASYYHTRDAVLDKVKPDPEVPIARIGTTHTIGMNLLSSCFNDWPELFGEEDPQHRPMKLHIDIGNTGDLLPRVNSNLLDCVIAHGRTNRRDVPQNLTDCREPGLEVCFRSLGYRSRMVLLCPPKGHLWMSDGTDAHGPEVKGRPKEQKGRKTPHEAIMARPHYDLLKPIRIEDIDFHRTELIFVPSWGQPEALERFVSNLRKSREVRVAHSYSEALTLVRMGLGVAPSIEVLCKRKNIRAFQLTPTEDYTRYIGAYYSSRFGVPSHVCRVLHFIEDYMREFESDLRTDGVPPGLDNPDYHPWCMKWKAEHDWSTAEWQILAQKHYPYNPNQ